MKKLLVCLLTLALLCSLFTFAQAEDAVVTYKNGSYKYILLSDDTAQITGFTGYSVRELVLPDVLDGHKVTSIDGRAFWSLFRLTKVTLPGSITDIQDNPFKNCNHLQEIEIAGHSERFAVTDGVLFDVIAQRLVCYPDGLTAETYTVPEGILSIGRGAFYANWHLKRVTLSASVARVEYQAFENCWNMEQIELPEQLAQIDECAFQSCLSLRDVSLPANIQSIGAYAFCRCTSLTGVSVPDGVASVGAYAFSNCEALVSAYLPASISTDEGVILAGCNALKRAAE